MAMARSVSAYIGPGSAGYDNSGCSFEEYRDRKNCGFESGVRSCGAYTDINTACAVCSSTYCVALGCTGISELDGQYAPIYGYGSGFQGQGVPC